jgi:hypothetical protein
MRARVRIGLLVLGAVGLVALPGVASAHDHELPEPVLHHAGQHQDAGFVEIQWVWATGPDTCIQGNFIGTGEFGDPPGRPVVVPFATPSVSIRIDGISHVPSQVELFSWRKLGRNGAPAGESTTHPVTVTPRVVRGEIVALDLSFTPPKRGHAYLQLFALWPDIEGCGGEEWGIWRFHLLAQNP